MMSTSFTITESINTPEFVSICHFSASHQEQLEVIIFMNK